MLPDGTSSEATPPESSLSTDIIVLEALLEAERDGVAAMNEVISILKLEIMQLAACIMQETQELEEVRMLHLKTEEVLLLLLSEAQGNPSSSLDTNLNCQYIIVLACCVMSLNGLCCKTPYVVHVL